MAGQRGTNAIRPLRRHAPGARRRLEAQRELGTATRLVRNPNCRTMIVGHGAHDRQTEPGTVTALAIAAPETLEDHFPFGFRNARAMVAHPQFAIGRHLDIDRAAGRAEFDGVFRQIEDRPMQHLGIAVDDDRSAATLERNVLLLGEREGGDRTDRFRADRVEIAVDPHPPDRQRGALRVGAIASELALDAKAVIKPVENPDGTDPQRRPPCRWRGSSLDGVSTSGRDAGFPLLSREFP